jgi:predicted PhzF superfamily epimerase YddE/YHI9
VDQKALDEINIDPGGVAVTAVGDSCDFVSRFFTPQASILEDPVTGSAHCSLTPFWADRLGKSKMLAQQLSNRGGVLHVELRKDSVWISGQAKTFMEGRIHLV